MSRNSVELVLLRNSFYRDYYYRALIALLLMLCVNGALVAVLTNKLLHPPPPQYFPVTANGRIITLHSLSDPVFSNRFIIQWATKAAISVYQLDFIHWRDQLQEASNYFSPQGWAWFISALKESNNLKTIKDQEMVSTATITGAPEMLNQGVVDGKYEWKLKMPLLITYTNGNHTIRQPVVLIMVIERMLITAAPQRIAISMYRAEQQASSC